MAPAEKIRVLIVDDIAETRENIRRMLQFDANIEVVGIARTGREAIDQAQQIKPDVILMDINMPDMDGITATQEIRRKQAATQVVILSVQGDASYMRRAMLAGARDFLTKPPMIDELTDAIHRAGAMAADERKKLAGAMLPGTESGGSAVQSAPLGKIIVVYSPKGGVGTTTLATNLAISLKTEDKRVALIDANLQYGDVAIFLNEQGKNTMLDLASRVDELDTDVVEEVMVTHRSSGIDILAAPPRPEMANEVSGEQFSKLLGFLRRIYAYIVIDTSAYLTDVVQSALELASITVLITSQDIPSIKNCNLFLNLMDAVGLRRDSLLFVMNRYDKKIAITPERVGESLHQTIAAAIMLDDKVVGNAINRGIPFMVDNKATPLAKSIQDLAELVKDKVAQLEGSEVAVSGKT